MLYYVWVYIQKKKKTKKNTRKLSLAGQSENVARMSCLYSSVCREDIVHRTARVFFYA